MFQISTKNLRITLPHLTIYLSPVPLEADILCCHPMFGPISGKNGWTDLRFIYEKTRVNKTILDHPDGSQEQEGKKALSRVARLSVKSIALTTIINEEDNRDLRKEGLDRMERFLSIWEEEGCAMKAMSCKDHDMYAAKSQFITHLMGRVLGEQGLKATPVDTKGFESVLSLVKSTNSDSYDLFYGLYKYNSYSPSVISDLRQAMNDVEAGLESADNDDNDM
jgi:arogenate dehydrogenase (NADP+)